jgi:hypothetical protein
VSQQDVIVLAVLPQIDFNHVLVNPIDDLNEKSRFLSNELGYFSNNLGNLSRDENVEYLTPLHELTQRFLAEFSAQLLNAQKMMLNIDKGVKELNVLFCMDSETPSFELFCAFEELTRNYRTAHDKRMSHLTSLTNKDAGAKSGERAKKAKKKGFLATTMAQIANTFKVKPKPVASAPNAPSHVSSLVPCLL